MLFRSWCPPTPRSHASVGVCAQAPGARVRRPRRARARCPPRPKPPSRRVMAAQSPHHPHPFHPTTHIHPLTPPPPHKQPSSPPLWVGPPPPLVRPIPSRPHMSSRAVLYAYRGLCVVWCFVVFDIQSELCFLGVAPGSPGPRRRSGPGGLPGPPGAVMTVAVVTAVSGHVVGSERFQRLHRP